MLNWTLKYWKAKPSYIGDIFVRAIKGTNQTSEDCYLARNDMSSSINRYVLFGYTLLGNPGLSVVYDGVQEIPSTGTRPPALEPVEDTLRPVDSGPLYESHDIPVDMIPAGGTASTTIKITPEEHPVATAVESEIKIRKVDALEVPGRS